MPAVAFMALSVVEVEGNRLLVVVGRELEAAVVSGSLAPARRKTTVSVAEEKRDASHSLGAAEHQAVLGGISLGCSDGGSGCSSGGGDLRIDVHGVGRLVGGDGSGGRSRSGSIGGVGLFNLEDIACVGKRTESAKSRGRSIERSSKAHSHPSSH